MIVVFDSNCNVCNFYVRFLSTRDRRHRLSFVPASSDRGRAALIGCGLPPDDLSTMLVIDGEHRLMRSDAAIAAIHALGGGWRGVRLLAIVPRRLRDALYTGFARRRYRWFGRAAECTTCDAPPGPLPRR